MLRKSSEWCLRSFVLGNRCISWFLDTSLLISSTRGLVFSILSSGPLTRFGVCITSSIKSASPAHYPRRVGLGYSSRQCLS